MLKLGLRGRGRWGVRGGGGDDGMGKLGVEGEEKDGMGRM